MSSVRRLSSSRSQLALWCWVGLSGCLYDPSQRCDAGQTYDPSADVCVCDASENKIAGEHGCVSCGAHEVAANDACSCEPGYERASASAPCLMVPESLGKPCARDADCTDATYDTCHLLSAGTSYCTSTGCTDSSDCAAGYACETRATPSYCQRPPEGAGKSCASDLDCAGTDATFCESFQTKVCYVEGCSLATNDCAAGTECCDLTAQSFGLIPKQICVATGSCTK